MNPKFEDVNYYEVRMPATPANVAKLVDFISYSLERNKSISVEIWQEDGEILLRNELLAKPCA